MSEKNSKQQKFQTIKGFYDILPEDTALWFKLEDITRRVLGQYGYQNIRMPVVEPTSLFVRSVGEHTDIVEKEMYAWEDQLNGDQLTLRPEGTAGCVRAVVQHNLTYNAPQRLWYIGPMFRHENVQKGRQRQFHQIGAEAFGFDSPQVDAEQIVMLARLWEALGIKDVALELNTIGDADERLAYRQTLIEYFESHVSALDEDAKRRLYTNPLRILDSKNPTMQEICEAAPKLIDSLGDDTKSHFEAVCHLLASQGIEYKINPRLVRGLDYYNRTVFEWVTTKLGSQGTIAGGGRYDTLVERLGGKPTPACGFAMGLERIFLLMQAYEISANHELEVYVISVGDSAESIAFKAAETLRNAGLTVVLNSNGGSFKSQIKKADKSQAKVAVIIGEDEVSQGRITIKGLRSTVELPQQQCSIEVAAALIMQAV